MGSIFFFFWLTQIRFFLKNWPSSWAPLRVRNVSSLSTACIILWNQQVILRSREQLKFNFETIWFWWKPKQVHKCTCRQGSTSVQAQNWRLGQEMLFLVIDSARLQFGKIAGSWLGSCTQLVPLKKKKKKTGSPKTVRVAFLGCCVACLISTHSTQNNIQPNQGYYVPVAGVQQGRTGIQRRDGSRIRRRRRKRICPWLFLWHPIFLLEWK